MGSDIRRFLRELFGSRLVERLELQLLQLRQDFESRLQDREQIIADLRAEKAIMQGRMSLYENTIMPLASRAGAQIAAANNPFKPKPVFPAEIMANRQKTRWELVQDEHEKMLAELDRQEKEAKAAPEQTANGTPAE